MLSMRTETSWLRIVSPSLCHPSRSLLTLWLSHRFRRCMSPRVKSWIQLTSRRPQIMAKFYISHKTFLAIKELPVGANMRTLLETLCSSAELGSFRFRQGEKSVRPSGSSLRRKWSDDPCSLKVLAKYNKVR